MVMFGLWYFVYMLGFSMCFANTMTCGMAVLPPELKADGNARCSTRSSSFPARLRPRSWPCSWALRRLDTVRLGTPNP